MRREYQSKKRYVLVQVRFDTEGNIRPMVIAFDATLSCAIDKVIDKLRAACQRFGGVGIRYTYMIQRQETYLWSEENRWFVEAKQ